MSGSRAVVLALLAIAAAPNSVLSYHGGPVRVEFAGFDSTTARVYYQLHAYDEFGYPPEVYYFDLEGRAPDKPIRDRSLEGSDDGPNPAWGEFWKSAQRLRSAGNFALALDVSADSVGVDSEYSVTRYDLTARVAAGSSTALLRVLAVCRTLVAVRGMYEIPGRPERVVVVSYCGRSYGCEEVEQPVLLGRP